MSQLKKAVLIGAGQYGRGVIGMLLEQAGYHVLLADINQAVIDDINTRGEYVVRRIHKSSSSVTVRNISAMSSLDPALADACASADIICTCVGLTALPLIAPVLAEAVKKRFSSGAEEGINVLACENALGGSTVLKGHVLRHLDAECAAYLESHVGFPDCAIDGIIPPVKDAAPADVTAEEYYEWDSLKSGFRGPLPQITGLNIVDDLSPYLERKLFTLNGPNAVTGALGWLRGYATVQAALEDPSIYSVVWEMMTEAGRMLSARHAFTEEEMLSYRTFIMSRFQNPAIIDSCVRVAREPIRKLAPNDRVIAAMNYAHAFGIKTPAYFKGIAALMAYDNPGDEQSCLIQQKIKTAGFLPALEELTGIAQGSETAAAVLSEYSLLLSSR